MSYSSIDLKTIAPFQLVHSDVWGPSPYSSLDGHRYYLDFVVDYTRYMWILPLKLKFEVPDLVLQFIRYVEQFHTMVQSFQSTWGGEYQKLLPTLNSLGIIFRHPSPHTHQQNGRVEHKHQFVIEIGLTLLARAFMDLKYWWGHFNLLYVF